MPPTDPSPVSEVSPGDIQRSSRDPGSLRRALESWLAQELPAGPGPGVSELTSPSANGLSSETLLFDVRWRERGTSIEEAFVARVEPDRNDCPVFSVYNLEALYNLLEIVAKYEGHLRTTPCATSSSIRSMRRSATASS